MRTFLHGEKGLVVEKVFLIFKSETTPMYMYINTSTVLDRKITVGGPTAVDKHELILPLIMQFPAKM